MKIKLLQSSPNFCFELVPLDDQGKLLAGVESLLIQSDWDYPVVASTFGWQACWCGHTDGTVDCKHKRAGDMHADAYHFLVAHDGEVVDDPGYFTKELTP